MRGQLGVDVGAAADDFPADGDDVFLAQRAGELGGFGVGVHVEAALRQAAAVAQVDEDEVLADGRGNC